MRDADPTDIATARTATSKIIPFDGGPARRESRPIAVEVPVQILFGGIPFAVMMLTPADLIDFAYGFSLTEGIIEAASDVREVELASEETGLQLRIGLAGDRLRDHFARQRAMTGRTGCGVCGIDDPAALNRAKPGGSSTVQPVGAAAIARALAAFDEAQTLNRTTRAVHGAAFARIDGSLVCVREDVGRHNALDKLIGALLRTGVDPQSGFIVISSRCSFEMVEKAAAFGARVLVAISAPTSLALERAETLDLTLVGIARRDTMTVFTRAERIFGSDAIETFSPN